MSAHDTRRHFGGQFKGWSVAEGRAVGILRCALGWWIVNSNPEKTFMSCGLQLTCKSLASFAGFNRPGGDALS